MLTIAFILFVVITLCSFAASLMPSDFNLFGFFGEIEADE